MHLSGMRAGPATAENTHLQKTKRWLRGQGVEIGAFTHPVEGIHPIYVDKFKDFFHQKCLADYKGDAVSLPFFSNSLDYVVSSHVLEHVANPVRALAEWYRVLKPGGYIYLVVPDKRFTFDHQRAVTPVSHLLDDFERGVNDHDGTHVRDFLDNMDWVKLLPEVTPEERERIRAESIASHTAALRDNLEHNIHFHTFLPETIRELVRAIRSFSPLSLEWELVDFAERFPVDRGDGILAVIKVCKSNTDRVRSAWQRWRKPAISYPVLPNAAKFS